MVSCVRPAARAVAGAMAAGAVGVAMLFSTTGSAAADPPMDDPEPAPSAQPNCTAADLAQVSSGVAAATSAYLFTHPDVNAYFTSLKGQPRDDMRAQLKQYMDANPQTHADLEGIRQPLTDFQNRCR
ncbi:membrane protein [Mycobacterium mantenii]|uniref:Membrane protein n=2 Tax=Mycobacterium mantenii TaxID=560555 RepID=A0ABM7JQ18_MYCNT|nr:membrane protein [Mycobacterium mantenii]